ncbi:MAG: hypothetical protein ACOCX5_05295 [Chloroflexota bacterium]
MESDKQKRIRYIFRQFSQHCPEISSQEFEIWEDTLYDPPDVFVPDLNLGIELVDFLHGAGKNGSHIKAAENVQDQIVEDAQRLFEEKHPEPYLVVSVRWHNWSLPRKPEQGAIRDCIVDIISKSPRPTTDQIIELSWEDLEGTVLEHHLDSIAIYNYDQQEQGHWTSPRAGWVGAELQAFEAIVRRKEQRLPWKKHANMQKCWLVVVADGSDISSIVIPDSSVKPGRIISKFNRVYFFNRLRDQNTLLSGNER